MLQLLERRVEAREPRALLLDDRRGRARDEALVRELGRRPWRSRPRGARSPWRGARARRRRSTSMCSISRISPTTSTGASVTGRSSTIFTSETFASAGRYGANSREQSRRRRPRAAAPSAPATAPSRRAARGRRRRGPSAAPCRASARGIDALEVRLRERLQRDRLARLAGERRDRLPQLLGDERHERMREPQRRLELAHQHRARAARRRRVVGRFGALQLDLRALEVPVAVLVPDELVERPGREVEPVAREVLGDVVLRPAAAGRAASGRRTTAPGLARRRGRSPCPRRSSARSASRSTACCRSCGSPRSGRGRSSACGRRSRGSRT